MISEIIHQVQALLDEGADPNAIGFYRLVFKIKLFILDKIEIIRSKLKYFTNRIILLGMLKTVKTVLLLHLLSTGGAVYMRLSL